MPRLVDNIGKVFHKYSFIAHIMNAISAVGMVVLAPFLGYIPIQAYALAVGTLALLGVAGSFIKQEVEDYEDDLKDNRVDDNVD
jgi:NADH:ubiquinone oxidoreductase subunit 6 (subunit J)